MTIRTGLLTIYFPLVVVPISQLGKLGVFEYCIIFIIFSVVLVAMLLPKSIATLRCNNLNRGTIWLIAPGAAFFTVWFSTLFFR